MPPRRPSTTKPAAALGRPGPKRFPVPAAEAVVGYDAFVTDLKTRIATARVTAARRVNSELVNLYWDIGAGIADKQANHGWGEAVVARLARDLQAAFPAARGFSAQNLWRMRQLHTTFTAPEFLAQAARVLFRGPGKLSRAVRELVSSVPWGHHAIQRTVSERSAGFFDAAKLESHFKARMPLDGVGIFRPLCQVNLF